MKELRVERRDRVLQVTIDRPERKNALSVPLWQELARVLADFASNDDDRVLVLTGAGGVFCAGGDLSGSGDEADAPRAGDSSLRVIQATVSAVCLGIHRAPKPVIAAVMRRRGWGSAGETCINAAGNSEMPMTRTTPMPMTIIQPKSITGRMPLTSSEPKATMVVIAV